MFYLEVESAWVYEDIKALDVAYEKNCWFVYFTGKTDLCTSKPGMGLTQEFTSVFVAHSWSVLII